MRILIAVMGWMMMANSVQAQETYTVIERKALLVRKPDIEGPNIKVWTIHRDETIRINFVEMSGELPLHKHPDAAHSLMVLSGRVQVQIGNEWKVIEEGDYISIPAGAPHKYRPLTEKSTLVSMDAPYYDPSKTIPLESAANASIDSTDAQPSPHEADFNKRNSRSESLSKRK